MSAPSVQPAPGESAASTSTPRWAKVVDHEVCIGCHACTTACKSENEVPLSVTRTYVKAVDVGAFPQARRAFQVTRCNQCDDAPCTTACPTSAMVRREDGIVDFDKSVCIGCKACIAACPYDAIFINPEDGAAEKCNFCAHRLDVGLEPACVVVCPTEALLVGDLQDPHSRVSEIVHREPVTVRRPEKETRPKLFYRGAHQATLDPLAAQRPEGGLFMWSEQAVGHEAVVGGHPNPPNSSAGALLSYDAPHSMPWDWRVSLYTLTKGVATGLYLVVWALALAGVVEAEGSLWQLWTPLVSLFFLALTGALLLWDLEHPERFFMIFTRPQWKSWLVRGAFALTAYGGVLAAHTVLGWMGRPGATMVLALLGVPLALLTAVYTAYLFAQAKARDLWQNPALPGHMLLQALLAGAATLSVLSGLGVVRDLAWWPRSQGVLLWTIGALSFAHLAWVAAELTTEHATAHGRLAVHEMTRGRFRAFFTAGLVLVGVAALAPWVGPMVAGFAALGGLLTYEHAYVQAGQAVPLA